MPQTDSLRVGYVLKRFPRYSETFIINEILAHEAAGLPIEIFSLRHPTDTYFAEQVRQVRAPVTYLPSGESATDFWEALEEANEVFPEFRSFLKATREVGATIGCQALTLACAARRNGIRHLHAHFATTATTVARLAARLAGISYSFTAHAKDIFHESVQHCDLNRKLHDAASVVTVSDFNRRHLQETFGRSAERVERVYNGLDLANFPYREPDGRPTRIAGVGRLVEKKGFGDLIEACAILARRGCPFTCQIIGGGELEAELKERVERFGLNDRVELAGPQPQSEVIRACQDAAVLAAPCIVGSDGNRDGLPTVLLEAMALGTPCVSTDVTGIPEVLRDGETGLVVPQRDPVALAAALEQLLTQPELRMLVAARARRLVENEFDIHRNTACIRDLFRAAQPVLSRGPAAQLQGSC